MEKQFFDQKIVTQFEVPLQKLMELNVKMMKSLSYVKPIDLLSVKKPEEVLEKQIDLFVQNNYMLLDYVRTAFSILENHWINISSNSNPHKPKAVHEQLTTKEKAGKKAHNATKSFVTKKTTTKKTTLATKKSALTNKQKSAEKMTGSAKISKAKVTKEVQKKGKNPLSSETTTSTIHLKGPLVQGTTHKNIPNVSKTNFPN